MPVTTDPTVATQLAQFGDAANEAASIKYNVLLPGAYSIQRVVPLELPQDLFNATSMNVGTHYPSTHSGECQQGTAGAPTPVPRRCLRSGSDAPPIIPPSLVHAGVK